MWLNEQSLGNFGLAILTSSLCLVGCSREMEKATSVSLQLPRVIQSKGAGSLSSSSEMIGTYIVSISGSGFAPVIVQWDARKMCASATSATECVVPPMELVVPKGTNRMIQVLGVSGSGPGTSMSLYYFGSARNLSGNSEAIDVTLQKLQQTSGTEVVVKGRFLDSASSGPSGSVLMQFHPPVAGHPPMNLFRREILNGWFNFEFFSGFEVSYVLERQARVLFSRVRAGNDLMGSAAGVSGVFNPAARAPGARMSLLHVAVPATESFWTRNENGVTSVDFSDGDIRSRAASRIVVGFFGPAEFLLGKRVCHDPESSSGIHGLYAAGASSSATLRVGEVAAGAFKTGADLETALDALSIQWSGYQSSLVAGKISVVQPDYDAGTSTNGAGRSCASVPDWNNEIRLNEATIMQAGNEIDNIISFRGPFVERASFSASNHEGPFIHVAGNGDQIQSVGFNLMPGLIGNGVSGASVFYRFLSDSAQEDYEFDDNGGIQCQAISSGAFGFQRFGPDIITDSGITADEILSAPGGLTVPMDFRFQVVVCPFSDAVFGGRSYFSSGLTSGYYGGNSAGGPGPGPGGPSCPATPQYAPVRLRLVYNPEPVDVGTCVNIQAQLVDQFGCPAVVTASQILELGFPTFSSGFPVSDSKLYHGQDCNAGNLFIEDSPNNKQKHQFVLAAGQDEVDLSLDILSVPTAAREFNLTSNSVTVELDAVSLSKEGRPSLFARPTTPQAPDTFTMMGPSLTALRMGDCREIQLTAMRNTPTYTAVKVNVAYQVSVTLTANGGGHLALYDTEGCTGASLGDSANILFPVGSSVGKVYLKGAALSTGAVATVNYGLNPSGPTFPSSHSIVVYGAPVNFSVLNAIPDPMASSMYFGGPGFCKMIDLRVRDSANNDVNMLGSQVFMPETITISSGAPALRAFRSSSGCVSGSSMFEIPLNGPVRFADGMNSISSIYVRSNNVVGTSTLGIELGNGGVNWSRNFIFHDVHQLKLSNIDYVAPDSCTEANIQYGFYKNDGTLSGAIPNVQWSLSGVTFYHSGSSGTFKTDAGCSMGAEPVVPMTSTGGAQPPPIPFYVQLSPSGTLSLSNGTATFGGETLSMDLSGTVSYP